MAALLDDLDSDNFQKREEATRWLEGMEGARPALLEVLGRRPGPERRRRIERLVRGWDDYSHNASLLRTLQGVRVLEQIAGQEARALLRQLAGGVPDAHLTHEAKGALERLSRRPGSEP
jgi:hypothetical protein